MQVGVNIGDYTFAPGGAGLGTITINQKNGSGTLPITSAHQIKPIVNGTQGVVIFNPADASLGGTLAGNVLTLEYDTSAHGANDDLYICVNLPNKSINNSTDTVPTIATPFTGIVDEISPYALLTFAVTYKASADHTGTLFLEFSPNGADWTAVDGGIYVAAGTSATLKRFPPRTLTRIDTYLRVRYVPDDDNLTAFHLETMYSQTQNAKLTSRLDGNLNGTEDVELTKSAIVGSDDFGKFQTARVTTNRELGVSIFDPETGSQTIVDLNGSLKVGTATNILGTAFGDAAPSDNQWSTIGTGSGVRNDIPGAISLETGTTADSTISFQSTTKARFVAANFNVLHIGCNINNIAAVDNVRTWGAYNPQDGTTDGVWFRLDSGVMCVGYTKQNVETVVLQSNWNGASKDKFVLDTKTRVYEVQYNAGAIKFFQNGNELHTVTSFDEVYAGLYNFKLALNNENINGNTDDNFIQSRALAIYRIGEERGATISRTFPTGVTVVKAGAGYVESVTLARSGGGSSGSSLTIYDSTTASGDELGVIKISKDETYTLNINSTFTNGLTIEVSATGATDATVVWE